MEELEKEGGNLPAIASNALIDIAEQAEKRIEAIIKIKKVALKVTNRYDWTNQQNRPYLQVSGAEKIANLFNISWRIDEPRLEFEDDGHFTYTFKGEFSLAGRTIEVEGSRSSKDPFFKKYEWNTVDGKRVRTEKPISAIDKRDVKMAALTNLLGNGISRILGIRNLQWSDLQEFAGIKMEDVAGVEYKKEGERQPLQEPQKKQEGQPSGNGGGKKVVTPISNVTEKKGVKDGKPWTLTTIFGTVEGNEVSFRTFSDSPTKTIGKEIGTGTLFEIEYETNKYGNDLKTIRSMGPEPPDDNAQN